MKKFVIIRTDLGNGTCYVPATKLDETHAAPVKGMKQFRSAKNARREVKRIYGGELDGFLWTVDNRTMPAATKHNMRLHVQAGHSVPVMMVR